MPTAKTRRPQFPATLFSGGVWMEHQDGGKILPIRPAFHTLEEIKEYTPNFAGWLLNEDPELAFMGASMITTLRKTATVPIEPTTWQANGIQYPPQQRFVDYLRLVTQPKLYQATILPEDSDTKQEYFKSGPTVTASMQPDAIINILSRLMLTFDKSSTHIGLYEPVKNQVYYWQDDRLEDITSLDAFPLGG